MRVSFPPPLFGSSKANRSSHLLPFIMFHCSNPTYVSPTDSMMTPVSQKLNATKKKHFTRCAHPSTLSWSLHIDADRAPDRQGRCEAHGLSVRPAGRRRRCVRLGLGRRGRCAPATAAATTGRDRQQDGRGREPVLSAVILHCRVQPPFASLCTHHRHRLPEGRERHLVTAVDFVLDLSTTPPPCPHTRLRARFAPYPVSRIVARSSCFVLAPRSLTTPTTPRLRLRLPRPARAHLYSLICVDS